MRERPLLLSVAALFLLALSASPGRMAQDTDLDAEEAKDRAIAERFQRVLEGNPRRGTALDRLYGYYVERGLLDKLIADYTARTKKNADDGVAWMILGIVESQRGRDAAAVAAFRQAETSRPKDALAPYYLGQSLILIGQPDAAAEAFERAIRCQPNRNDLLDIFQALGRVYQRAQRAEKALDVWNRLEKLFPDDPRVQEQIATTLTEEGRFDQALPRLVKLADQTDDKYRQSSLRMDIADLKVKLKRTTEALSDLEKILSDLNPDSWLYRDVRRRTEEVFMRNDDVAGLAKYYEQWLDKHPTDVDAIARLAKTLTTQGRAPEAKTWLSKGIAAAPSHRGLRQALIDQWVAEQNVVAAAREYEALDKSNPNNPDILREWGKLLLRDTSRPEAERRAAAAAVWKHLLDKKPNDPVIVAQVADLMRTASAVDETLALYKKAIALAPEAAQYREYLGEYLHSLNRQDEALATWKPIAEGKSRTSKNLARLAEVLAGFGYRKEAVAALADAITLEKDDFNLLMTYGELLHQDGRNDDALLQVAAAARLTSNPEEVEQVLLAQIKIHQAADKLGEKINELQADLDAGKEAIPERWLRLARFYEANRQADKANEVITKALEMNARSIPALIAAARIYESAGNLLAATEANRKLAVLDRRYRSEYLTAVAKLEQRLGRREQALQAGRDLLAASPGNPEVYKFFADLCFQLGDQEEGLEALRRSVRANPSDPQGLLVLANALAERVRQGEAIELLWRAFEKSNNLDGKLGIVERLTTLYLENNQLDRLLERLERERLESDKAREITLCIAQAYTTAGDLGTARQKLERLLTENTRDTHLLTQLGILCEQEGDVPAAVKYQRQLISAAPGNHDHQQRLAHLLTRAGEAEEAAEIWVKLAADQVEPHRNLVSIDALFTAGKHDMGLAILSRLLARTPGNWELLYREGAALVAQRKTDEAAKRFNAILALNLADDDLSENAKYQIKQAKKNQAKPGPAQPNNPNAMGRYDEWTSPPLTRRTGRAYLIRRATGMDPDYYYGGPQAFYAPSDYGEARMACLGWLYEATHAKGEGDAFVARLKKGKDTGGAEMRPLWDWYYFQKLRNERKDALPTALALSKAGRADGLLALLLELGDARGRRGGNRGYRPGRGEAKDNTPPLPAEQLEHALACFRKLKQTKPDWATSGVTTAIITELRRSKRTDDEKTFYQGIVQDATTVAKVQAALPVAANRKDVETSMELFGRLERLQPAVKNAASLNQLPSRQSHQTLVTLMGRLSDEKRLADSRKVMDMYLASVRRQNLMAPRSASMSSPTQYGNQGIQLYSPNPGYRRAQVEYPQANDYYDQGAITLLYNAFDLHKRADLVSDLFAHFRQQLESAKRPEKVYIQLAIGYLHWWAGEKDQALTALTEAVAAAPSDHALLIEVAALRERSNEFDTALALLDSITPLNTQMMQRREDAALRLAERTGNLERARQAAERLFGLRLDSDKQLELASRMHRLGLPELAETVLGRAQRQSGNKMAVLVRLMTQYQSQNQTEQAVLLARQILRKGPSMNTSFRGGGDENEGARSQAIGVLARSGNLKEMTERAEAQLKVSPNSVQLHQAVVGFYQASGDKAKLKSTLLKMAELKPSDGKLRFQVAQQLLQAGERDAALDEYKAALKLDPTAFGQNIWQVYRYFLQANRFEELAQLFDEIDFRKLGHYYYVIEMITPLLSDDKGRDLGLKLFKKAWEAYPENRNALLSELDDSSIWRLPEIYVYAKQAVIPRADADVDPWEAASLINGRSGGDGRMDSVLNKMMSIARKQQRLSELRGEVADALAHRPEWTMGKALLAVIDIQLGDKKRGQEEWRECFENPKEEPPALARFVFCQELEFYSGCESMAVKTLEGGIDELLRDGEYQFSWGPARRLVWWYQLLGRTEDAKKLLIRFADPSEATDPGYGPGGYWQYRLVHDAINVAQALESMGEPVEALRIYSRLLADKETLDLAAQVNGERIHDQLRGGMRSAVKSIRPTTLPAAMQSLLTPQPPAANQPVLDLLVLADSRSLAKAKVSSLVATAFQATSKAPDIRRAAIAKLDELAKKHPTDFSVHIASALAAIYDDDSPAASAAVDRLVKLTEATPLESLPPGVKPNARHRVEAAPQIPLWLVARECLSKERTALRAAGQKLAERAAAAARRQQDLDLALAILREWGQIELERGDKAKAEARWQELFELALPKPVTPKAAGAAAPDADADALTLVATQVPPPAASVYKAVAARAGDSIITGEQFQRAFELAQLAADNGMTRLSLNIMRQAVRGGPPVIETRGRQGGGPLRSVMINGVQYLVSGEQPSTTDVDKALRILQTKWTKNLVAPGEIYDVLAAAVCPEGRPAEVFLYNEGQTLTNAYKLVGGMWRPTDEPLETEGGVDGLAESIIRAAVEAGKVDDLRARVEARARQPLAELPGKLLLTSLALATKDQKRVAKMFEALAERINKDSLQATNTRVAAVVVPAFAQAEHAKMLLPLMDRLAQNHVASSNNPKAAEIRFKLAEYHLARKDEAAARAQFKIVEGLGKSIRGDYDAHLPLSQEYLKAGWVDDALREFGVHSDALTAAGADPRSRNRRTEPTIQELPWLVRLLLDMPADQRYGTLKAWSLPTADRKSVRYYVGIMPKDLPPPGFVKLTSFPADQSVSTMLLLADAARQAGKLDELYAASQKLAADKVENADLLHALVLLSQKKDDPAREQIVKTFVEVVQQRHQEKPATTIRSPYFYNEEEQCPGTAFRESELLCAALCLEDVALAKYGEALLMSLQAAAPNGTPHRSRIDALRRQVMLARLGAPNAMAGGMPAAWHTSPASGVWIAQDGYLKNVEGNDVHLLLDRPIAGAFKFSVDAFQGGGSEIRAGYGGAVFAPGENPPKVHSVGGDTVVKVMEGIHDQEFNRLSVEVAPGKIRSLVNGRLYIEDTEASPTAPWVMLPGGTVYRNFALTGKPEVLSEVKMTSGSFLDGWRTFPAGGRTPQRMAQKDRKNREADDEPDDNVVKEPIYDWQARDGELLGRKHEQPGGRVTPNCLAYFRSLRPGEAVRYEFFYEPGKSHVHPSLGRQVFLLEPEGVRLHWMISAGAEDWLRLPPDNAIDDPAGRRGKFDLKSGVWNQVKVTATASGVELQLNGTLVYEGSLSAGVDSSFGLFHYRDQTAARVRNVVLTGPWSKEVGTSQGLALSVKPPSPAVALARRWLVGESYFATEAAALVARARKLPAAERYKVLADWVLPSAERPVLQIAGQIVPRDVLPSTEGKPDRPGTRLFLGGEFVIPALEMIRAAKEGGTLDDLCTQLADMSAASGDELSRRSQLALLAVSLAARGDDAAAAETVLDLVKRATPLPIYAPGRDRWPDLVAILGLARYPALQKTALQLADVENENLERSISQNKGFEERDWWLRAFGAARSKLEPLAPPLTNWAPISSLTAQSRSAGWGAPLWVMQGNSIVHCPGHDGDYLIFRTPLRGDFEVTCELTLKQMQQAQICYGGYQLELTEDGKKYALHTTVRLGAAFTTIRPPLKLAKKDNYECRLSVHEGWLKAFIDGREIGAERIGLNPDPWLMIHVRHANTAKVTNLKLSGRPTVPDKVDMLLNDDLAMWRSYVGGGMPTERRGRFFDGNNQPGWLKRGEEMYALGKKPEPPEKGKPEPPRSFPESAVYYQRPLVGNGAVDYEFFYDPDKALVHPALDRLTFLLEPDGVKLHWLTDGRHDKGGLPFDNSTDEPAARRGPAKLPLKEKEWNQVRLSVAGDAVSIRLNDTLVYERPIEQTNQRLFGLFHYTDRTEARVRGMVLTGDWPREVPLENLFSQPN